MTDNVAITAGSGTDIATDSVGGAHYQRVKVVWGTDGTVTDASASDPLPVVQTGTVTVGSHAVTNAGTFLVQENGAAATSLALLDDTIIADDAAFTPATTKVAMAGFTFDDVAPDSVNEGDAGAARMSANRNVYTTIRDAAGNERGLNIDSSGQLAVTLAASQTLSTVTTVGTVSSVSAVIAGTGATNLGKAQDSAVGSTDTGVAPLYVRDDALSTITPAESDYAVGRVNARGAVWVAIDGAESGGLIDTGTAGSASSEVVTVQGVASMTPVAVVGKTVLKTITMTPDTSIMASADIIADTQQLDAAFRVTDGTGVLQSMTVFDSDDNTAFAFDVYVHRTSTSMGSENGAISITDANAAAGIIGVVSFATTDAKDLINGKMYHKSNIGLPVQAVSGTDDLYFSVVNGSGTPTFAGASMPIVVGILQD